MYTGFISICLEVFGVAGHHLFRDYLHTRPAIEKTVVNRSLKMLSYALEVKSIKATVYFAVGHLDRKSVSKFILKNPVTVCNIHSFTEYFGEILVIYSLTTLQAARSCRRLFHGRYVSVNHDRIWYSFLSLFLVVEVVHYIVQMAVCGSYCNGVTFNLLSYISFDIKPIPKVRQCYFPLFEICGCLAILTYVASIICKFSHIFLKKIKATKAPGTLLYMVRQNQISSLQILAEGDSAKVDGEDKAVQGRGVAVHNTVLEGGDDNAVEEGGSDDSEVQEEGNANAVQAGGMDCVVQVSLKDNAFHESKKENAVKKGGNVFSVQKREEKDTVLYEEGNNGVIAEGDNDAVQVNKEDDLDQVVRKSDDAVTVDGKDYAILVGDDDVVQKGKEETMPDVVLIPLPALTMVQTQSLQEVVNQQTVSPSSFDVPSEKITTISSQVFKKRHLKMKRSSNKRKLLQLVSSSYLRWSMEGLPALVAALFTFALLMSDLYPEAYSFEVAQILFRIIHVLVCIFPWLVILSVEDILERLNRLWVNHELYILLFS